MEPAYQFQSTRPCGARLARHDLSWRYGKCFNPRARAGRDQVAKLALAVSECFNPRARAGRDEGTVNANALILQFQSTRPCGARHGDHVSCPTCRLVSIHAPVRGATRSRAVPSRTRRVSIHAPVRGATSPISSVNPSSPRFNPRARAGRDKLISSIVVNDIWFQSTRPCGARHFGRLMGPYPGGSFNPRARAGRDPARDTCCGGYGQGFNPRARAGRDPVGIVGPDIWSSFNPRARAGRDMAMQGVSAISERFQSTRPCGARRCRDEAAPLLEHVSIHAPVRGATRTLRYHGQQQPVSIHAPVRGATIAKWWTTHNALLFQSTRPCGARRNRVGGMARDGVFQSTRPCGARRRRKPLASGCDQVSIHAPVRGATIPIPLSTASSMRFQSTRPCGARQRQSGRVQGPDHVSIHAPVRGATNGGSNPPPSIGVSIHAPVRGATHRPPHPGERALCFNPRARAGRDQPKSGRRSLPL